MKKPSKKVLTGATAAAALILGICIGGAGAQAQGAYQPTPATVSKAEPVSKTPQVCVDALDQAGQFIAMASEGMGYSIDSNVALLSNDPSGVITASNKLDGVTTRLSAMQSQYVASREACYASAK